MKKTFLLMKMLFFLALLCVGQSAWADDVTVLKYSFDDASSPSLTAGSRVTLDYSRTSVITNTKFLNAYNNANGDPGSTTLSLGSKDLSEETWTLEFEWAACGGCNSKVDHTILKAGETTLFDISGDSNWNTTVTLSYGQGGSATLPVPGCDKGKRFTANVGDQYNTTTYWHHFKITGSVAEGVTLTVTNSDSGTKVVDGVTLSATNVNPTSIVIEPCCGGAIAMDELHLYYYSEVEAVSIPTAAITAVDGINRTVTFSCASDGATLYYSTDNGETYTEGTSLVISADTNIKVKATKGTASAESESLAFEAGTEIVLNAPTWTKTGSSDGISTVTLADDQSNKLLTPVSTIMYQINDGAEQTYSSAISVNDGETLKFWSVATGYTNSAVGSVVAATPNTNETIISENYVGVVSENNNLSLADGEGYRKMYYNGGADLVSENLLASNINSGNYYQMYRAKGLYASVGWNLAIPNLKAGDYVTLNGVYGNAVFSIGGASNMIADEWNSTAGSKYCFTVNADGDVTFSMGRYGYLTSITIQRAPKSDIVYTAPVAVEGLVANGEAQALVTAGTVEEGGEMQYSLDGENYGTDIPTAIEAGEYTVYFKIVADATHNDVDAQTIVVTVAAPKADIIYTAPEGIEGLVANGEAQALITAGTVEEGGEMQYSLDGENYGTEIPTATEAAKYTVYYRIVADDTHKDVAAQEIFVTIITAELDAAKKDLVAAVEAAKAIDTEGKNGAEELAAAITAAEGAIFADDVTVSVVNTAKENLAAAVTEFEKANKKDIVYTAPVAVEGLVANGDQLNLIKAGTVEEGGEMQYSLDGEYYYTDIPIAFEAGEYTVYYRIVADETHNDVAAQTIVVTVAEPEKIYIVAGSSSEIFGQPWDGTYNANQMTMNDNGTYSKTYTVEGSVDDVSLKVVRNGSDWFGDAENHDVKFNLTGAGTFTVTFNPETSIVSVTGDIVEFPAVEYDITIAEGIVGGTVEVSSVSVKAGDEVTVTATPAEGYELASVSVTGVNSNQAVAVADGKFTMPEDAVTVSATFKKKAIYIETDLTSQFSALTNWQNWTGATGFTATNFCPAVAINDGTTKQVCEKYEGTCATTGDVFYQTITGLAAGTYKIELYGGAAYTFGRGFSSEAFSEGTWNAGDKIEPSAEVSTGVVLSATTSEGTYGGEIPIYYATNFPDGAATVTLDGVKVGANGELRIGMSKTSQSTNWHVVQLKGVTAQVDAIELHAVTLASAQAALSAEVNAVVVGEEKTALEAAIANNSEVTELTSEAYETAINALKAATNAFTSAREAYAALASTKESLVEYAKKYVYASAEKTAAVTAAAEGEPTSAADATSKNANLIAALRAMAESHAKAEGVEGAEAIAITNPSAEDSTNGWTTVKGEGSGGSINILENEPWTSADGSTAHKYFDGGNWGASAWDVSLTQDVELGAGKYMLSAIGRASGDVALTLFAGENKAAMPAINATGGLFDRGWNLSSVEFEVEAKSTVTIGVQGVTSVVHNWMSFSDFKLVLIESHAIKDAKAELLEAINEAKAIDTEGKNGAKELATAITVAEGVYNNQEATVEGVNTAKSDLAAAVAAFNTANAKYSALTYTITGQSSIKATIKKGKAVLDIIPEEGWAVSELKVNGEDALEQLADNKLVVNVDADATLVEVTFGWADAENMYEEDEVTGIATIADEGIKVYAQGNQICVEGAAGKVVRVYTLYGSLLKAATPSENKVAKFSVAAGTYVVQVGNKAAKISVK